MTDERGKRDEPETERVSLKRRETCRKLIRLGIEEEKDFLTTTERVLKGSTRTVGGSERDVILCRRKVGNGVGVD